MIYIMDLLATVKHLVDQGDLREIQEVLATADFQQEDPAHLFQNVYLHACLRKQVAIAQWLECTVFPTLDPIVQIAVRQCFAYGKYLLRQKNP